MKEMSIVRIKISFGRGILCNEVTKEDIQHALIQTLSVKVKVIVCVGHESIVETGGRAPFIFFLCTRWDKWSDSLPDRFTAV